MDSPNMQESKEVSEVRLVHLLPSRGNQQRGPRGHRGELL